MLNIIMANRLTKVDGAKTVRYHAKLIVLASGPDSANIVVADCTQPRHPRGIATVTRKRADVGA